MDNKNICLLALLILILGFFATDNKYFTGGAVSSSSKVTIKDLKCLSERNGYVISGAVSWYVPQGEYAKMSGVQDLRSAEKHYDNEFAYIMPAKRDGRYAVNVYIYDANDRLLLKNFEHKVTCSKAVSAASDYSGYVQFTAESSRPQRSDGEGTVSLALPGEPERCEFSGKYVTGRREYGYDARGGSGCVGGTGDFYGYADASGQRGEDSPGYFYWRGEVQGQFTPQKSSYEGYILSMWTCGTRYRSTQGDRALTNYVNLKVTNFGKRMVFGWTYHDDEFRPMVDVTMRVTCKMKQMPKTVAAAYPEESAPEEAVPLEESVELDLENAEPLEAEEEASEPVAEVPQRLSWWQRFKSLFEF